MEDAELYQFSSEPSVPREKTPDVLVKFQVVTSTQPCLFSLSIHVCSRSSVREIRKRISKDFRHCFENGFVFLCKNKEVVRSKEKTLTLFDILPKSGKGEPPNTQFRYPGVKYSKLAYDSDSGRRFTRCVGLVFLFEASSTSHWNAKHLGARIDAGSVHHFAFRPSCITSANTITIDLRINELCEIAARNVTSSDDKEKIKSEKRAQIKAISQIFNMIGYDNPAESLQDAREATPLHYAAMNGNRHICEYIIMNCGPAMVQLRDVNNNTPLQCALNYRKLRTAAYLLEHTLDLNTPDIGGVTCYNMLFNLTNEDTKTLLNALDPEVVDYVIVLHLACFALQFRMLDEAKRICKSLLPLPIESSFFRRPPLHLAAEFGDMEIVEILLNNSHSVMHRDPDGHLPFHYACQHGKQELIPLLYDNSMEENDYLKGMEIAVFHKRYETILSVVQCRPKKLMPREFAYELIVQASKQFKLAEKLAPCLTLHPMGIQLLMHAAYSGNKQVFELMVDNNWPSDYMGRNVIHYIALKGHAHLLTSVTGVIKTAVAVQDWQGSTPMHCACMAGKVDVIKTLVKIEGIRLDSKDHLGRTPFLVATHHKKHDVVKYLISNHSDAICVRSEDVYGKTILHYLSNMNSKVIDRILKLFVKETSPVIGDRQKTKLYEPVIAESWANPNNGIGIDFAIQNDVKEQEHTINPPNRLPNMTVCRLCGRHWKRGIRHSACFCTSSGTGDDDTSSTGDDDTSGANGNNKADNGLLVAVGEPFEFHKYRNNNELSAAETAIIQNSPKVLQSLLDVCSSWYEREERKQLAQFASKHWRLECLMCVFTNNDPEDETLDMCLHNAVLTKPDDELEHKAQLDIIEYLLVLGATPNFLPKKSFEEFTGMKFQSSYVPVRILELCSILEIAVIREDVVLVDLLLKYKASTSTNFATHFSALTGNLEIFKNIIKQFKQDTEHPTKCPDNELRYVCQLESGILQAACSSKRPSLDMFKMILKYVPGVIRCKKLLTPRMLKQTRPAIKDILICQGDKVLESLSSSKRTVHILPAMALLLSKLNNQIKYSDTENQLCFLIENGMFLHDVRVRRKTYVHGACSLFYSAKQMKMWRVVEFVLKYAGDFIWKCLLSENSKCMLHLEKNEFSNFINIPLQTLRVMFEKGKETMMKMSMHTIKRFHFYNEPETSHGNIHPFQQYIEHVIQSRYDTYVYSYGPIYETWFKIIILFPNAVHTSKMWSKLFDLQMSKFFESPLSQLLHGISFHDVTVVEYGHWSLLHVAAYSGLVKMADLCFSAILPMDVNARTDDGLTALDIAAGNSDVVMIEYLRKHKATATIITMKHACNGPLIQKVKKTSELNDKDRRKAVEAVYVGSNIDVNMGISRADLQRTITDRTSTTESSSSLNVSGSTDNLTVKQKISLLELAGINKLWSVIEFLLDVGASVKVASDMFCDSNRTIFGLILRSAPASTAIQFINAATGLTRENELNMLKEAMRGQHPSVIRKSIKHLFQNKLLFSMSWFHQNGWFHEMESPSFYTPLEVICINDHLDIFQYILEQTARSRQQIHLDTQNRERKTPLWYALTSNNFELAELLLLNGATSTGKWNILGFCQKRHFKQVSSFRSVCSNNKTHFQVLQNNSGNICALFDLKNHADAKLPTTSKEKTWNTKMTIIQGTDTLNQKARQRMLYLLSLAHFARQQNTTILHVVAAVGDVELMTRIMSMPYYPFLIKDYHEHSPLFYAIVNQQVDMCMLCTDNVTIDYSDKELLEAWIFCTLRSQNPKFLQKLKVMLWSRKLDVIQTQVEHMIEKLEQIGKGLSRFIHPETEHKTIDDQSLEKIFQLVLLKTKNITDIALFLAAVLGKSYLTNTIVNTFQNDAKYHFTRKLVDRLTYPDIVVCFSMRLSSNSNRMEPNDRAQCLETVLKVRGITFTTLIIDIAITTGNLPLVSDTMDGLHNKLDWINEKHCISYYSALEVICIENHLEILQRILDSSAKSGKQINLDSEHRHRTPLWHALTGNNLEIVELLLLNGSLSVGKSAILGICQRKHFKSHQMSILHFKSNPKRHFPSLINNSRNIYDLWDLEQHIDVKQPPVTNKFKTCKRELTTINLTDTLNPKARKHMLYLMSLAHFARQQDTTILHVAAAVGDVELVSRIMSVSYYPFLIKDVHGYFPLFYAIVNQQIDMCVLCKQNAVINGGKTELMEAWIVCALISQKPLFLQKLKAKLRKRKVDIAKKAVLEMISKLEQVANTLSRFIHPNIESKELNIDAELFQVILLKNKQITDLVLFLTAVLGKSNLVDIIVNTLKTDAKQYFTKKLTADLTFLELLVYFMENNSRSTEAIERKQCLEMVLKVTGTAISKTSIDISIANRSLSVISDLMVHFQANTIPIKTGEQEKWSAILVHSCAQGCFHLVQLICNSLAFPDLNKVCKMNCIKALCFAAWHKHTQIMHLLLTKGIRPDDYLQIADENLPKDCTAALHFAVLAADRSILQDLLVPIGDNYLKQDIIIESISLSAKKGNVNIFTLLVQYGQSHYPTIFSNDFLASIWLSSVRNGHEDISLVIKRDLKFTDVSVHDTDGITALHYACHWEMFKLTEEILQIALPNARDNWKMTPLGYARSMGHVRLSLYLINQSTVKVQTNSYKLNVTGWMKYLLSDNLEKSNGEVSLKSFQGKDGGCTSIVDLLRWGDDSGACAMLEAAQETAIAVMDESYQTFPLFHLSAETGCSKTIEKLLELTKHYDMSKISVWLNHKVKGYVPLALAIKANNVKCADILNQYDTGLDWNHDHTGETILHLLVRTNNKDMFDTIVKEAIITENIAEDKGGLSPTTLAIALGHHYALTHFNVITNPNHSEHVKTDYSCSNCLLDMGIGWSKLYMSGQEQHIDPFRDIFDIQPRRTDFKHDDCEMSHSLCRILDWMHISENERILLSILRAMGYEQTIENGFLFYLLCTVNEQTDIVVYCLNRGKQAVAIKCLQNLQTSKTLTDEFWQNVFIHSIANARCEVLDFIMQNNNPQTMLQALDKPTEYSSLEVAHAFGNRDVINMLQRHIQVDQIPLLVQQFAKITEVLPLKTRLLTGLGCVGDKDWVDSFSDIPSRLSNADVVLSQVYIQDFSLRENIEMHAQMDTVIPGTLANKYISVDFESLETSTKHLELPPALIKIIIASHIFGLFTHLTKPDDSGTQDPDKQFDSVLIKCLPPTSPDECLMEVQNKQLVDVVKFDSIVNNTLLKSSDDLPSQFSNEDQMCCQVTEDIIPIAEDKLQGILKQTVKISVDWMSVHNIGDKRLKSLAIHALAGNLGNNFLGGLQEVISQCGMYLTDVKELFGSMAVNSIMKLIEPLNKIIVRYAEEIPNSNKPEPFGSAENTVVWHFSFHKYHMIYLAKEFTILQTIKACHSVYVSLTNGVYRLSEAVRHTNVANNERSVVDRVELVVDWESFVIIGSSQALAEFGRTILGPCLIATGHHYREMLRLHTTVRHISLRNSVGEKETIMRLNNSRLEVVIHAVKSDSSKWVIDGIDTIKGWIDLEISQEEKGRLLLLCDDLSLPDADNNDERLCRFITENVIPAAEASLQAILKHSVKVHVDWTTIHNIDDKQLKSLVILALTGTLSNNFLGGLQQVISECEIYLNDIEGLFGSKALDSVIKLVTPLKEIVVKYTDEILDSNKLAPFGLTDNKVVWHFSLDRFDLKYFARNFAILQTIKACHSVYLSLSSAVHLLSEAWKELDQRNKRRMFAQIELDINWTSFFSIGSSDSLAQYGRTVLGQNVFMIAHHYRQMLRLEANICHISLRNSASAKESMIQMNGNRLNIVVHTIKSHSNVWAIASFDVLKTWIEIEISQLLQDWNTISNSISHQHAKLQNALSYFEQMLHVDTSVLQNMKPVYEMIIRDNMRQTTHPSEILKQHLSYWASQMDSLMGQVIHTFLQFCPGIWLLKYSDLPSGFWSWVNRSALQNHFSSDSLFMVFRPRRHRRSSEVIGHSSDVIKIKEARAIKPEEMIGLWEYHPVGQVKDVRRLERISMTSLGGKLYYTPDSARMSNITDHLCENIQNIINTFSCENWIVATLSLNGLIPKYGPSVHYLNSASLFECHLIAAKLGIMISFVVDDIVAECNESCFEILAEIVLNTLCSFETNRIDEHRIILKDKFSDKPESSLYEQKLLVTKRLRCQDIIVIRLGDSDAKKVLWKVDGSQFNEGVSIWSSSPGTIFVNVKPIMEVLKQAMEKSQKRVQFKELDSLWQDASFTPMRGSFQDSLTAALNLCSDE